MSNIDEFNRLTLHILDSLYEVFPQFAMLNIDEFYENPGPEALANFEGTMSFLRDEGFLNYDRSAEARIYLGVQLTLGGLGLLNQIPDSVEKGTTIGDRIKRALKIGTKEAAKEAIKFVVAEGIKKGISS